MEPWRNVRYLARSPTINFYKINADTFWIHAPYLIEDSGVNLKFQKMKI
ncbi:hypothetical protein D1BOALGB6SA_1416 [Olavius sp. associated proteobacterium Delta 1]|nr:hypothetical protein D1BOALGB6SA_1416 [Olavius sp. associated proteobacterium Delta 1]